MRQRPLAFAIVALALAAAAALVGGSGFAATLAQEDNVRLRLAELPPASRALTVTYFTIAGQHDTNSGAVAAGVGSVADVTTTPRGVRVWHSISPADGRGTRIVQTGVANVVVAAGRSPRGCRAAICEALALQGRYRLGQLVRFSGSIYRGRRLRRYRGYVRIVGRGELQPDALSDRSDLGPHALYVPQLSKPLSRLVKNVGGTVRWTAPLNVGVVHGFSLRDLSDRLREAIVRIVRSSDPNNPAEATAPLALLNGLADRGETARARLLLVAGDAAALIVAFAAFAASVRRRDVLLADEQLQTFGATRVQSWLTRIAEAIVPSVTGVLVALAGLRASAEILERTRSYGRGFVDAALPATTVVVIVGVGLASALLLVLAAAPRRSRYGVGATELAAVVSLALVGWQTAATGALDPNQVAASANNPILILLPALAFFAAAVVLLRTLPLLLRIAERLARRAPFGVRLAFLTATRSPAQAAATTTFLAIALGGALFSLNYRQTLLRQGRDQADFAAGAAWRVVERGPLGNRGESDATPLTRFNRVSRERPTPVIRLDAQLPNVSPSVDPLPLQIVALPTARLRSIRGWRTGFSSLSRTAIAARLRPGPLRLHGVPVGAATAIRLWLRAQTEAPRIVVLHFLLPGQDFAFLRLGLIRNHWRRVQAPLPPSLRGAQLIGLEFLPTEVPLTHELDLGGEVDVARVAVRQRGQWAALNAISRWVAATPFVGSHAGLVQYGDFVSGPVKRGLQFELSGTLRPLIRPPIDLPQDLPALAGAPIAAATVDGSVEIEVGGRTLPLRVVGRAALFPTVTEHPPQFVVVDYDTLFAALNADQPGAVVPSEAWFFREKPPSFAAALHRPPFRVQRAVAAAPLATRLLDDPLAAGTRVVLLVTGIAAAALALLGLVMSTRSTLSSERLLLAEYEALGVAPPTLLRAAQLRLAALSAIGIVAAFVGALMAVRLVGAFVAVTGTGASPLPPIAPTVAWAAGLLVLVVVAACDAVAVSALVRRDFRESTATRLRA
jgi:hypothetical protein